jgi:glycosyltransferase involved in cell wall biosynthesis
MTAAKFKVCIFHFPTIENFHGYDIDSLDVSPYFPDIAPLTDAASVDQMYRDKNPAYIRFLRDFVEKFRDADLLICAHYNPIHPQVLQNELQKPIKVLGFVDDPPSTYVRGLPYLWAFDGAFYVSPSYNEQLLFKDALPRWGAQPNYWWPLIWPVHATSEGDMWPMIKPHAKALEQGDAFFRNRDIDLIYVGRPYTAKLDRLIQLKKRFGSRFHIYGRWPLGGYTGFVRWLKGRPPLWSRVKAISDRERAGLYYRARIGLNMHFSASPMETGNMRMYEVPAHGVMLLCDKAGLDAHSQIFEPDKEAVFYDSMEDAIQKIEYYLSHDAERERIARAGFARVHRDYDGETNLKQFLDWAIRLPRKQRAQDQENLRRLSCV